MRSREARYAVYLVDPGSDRATVLSLVQRLLKSTPAAAAECLQDLPCLITFCETEDAARDLVSRFRDLDAVAVVRPADKPLAPAPVEQVHATPPQRAIRIILLVLGVAQLGVCWLWYQEGRWVSAVFGLLLALYVLIYFGWPKR